MSKLDLKHKECLQEKKKKLKKENICKKLFDEFAEICGKIINKKCNYTLEEKSKDKIIVILIKQAINKFHEATKSPDFTFDITDKNGWNYLFWGIADHAIAQRILKELQKPNYDIDVKSFINIKDKDDRNSLEWVQAYIFKKPQLKEKHGWIKVASLLIKESADQSETLSLLNSKSKPSELVNNFEEASKEAPQESSKKSLKRKNFTKEYESVDVSTLDVSNLPITHLKLLKKKVDQAIENHNISSLITDPFLKNILEHNVNQLKNPNKKFRYSNKVLVAFDAKSVLEKDIKTTRKMQQKGLWYFDSSLKKYQKFDDNIHDSLVDQLIGVLWFNKGKFYLEDSLKVAAVPEDDPRKLLRGQKMLIAKKDIKPNKLIGVFTGIYLRTKSNEEEVSEDLIRQMKYLLEKKAPYGINTINSYAFDIVNNKGNVICILSCFNRSNPLAKMNASNTYSGKHKKTKANVEVRQVKLDGGLPIMIAYTNKEISKKDELLLDYGPNYWGAEPNSEIFNPDAPPYCAFARRYISDPRLNPQPQRIKFDFLHFIKNHPKYQLFYNKMVEQYEPECFALKAKNEKIYTISSINGSEEIKFNEYKDHFKDVLEIVPILGTLNYEMLDCI